MNRISIFRSSKFGNDHHPYSEDRGFRCRAGAIIQDPNKLLAQRFIDILDRRELDKLGEVLSEDIVWHGTGGIGKLRGIQSYRTMVGQAFRSFADSSTTIDILLSEQNMVAIRYTVRATHKGDFLGFPPTEGKVSMATNMIARISGEKIVEIWHGADPVGLIMANK